MKKGIALLGMGAALALNIGAAAKKPPNVILILTLCYLRMGK